LNIKIPFSDFGGTGPALHFAHANGFPPGCYQTLLKGLSTDFHVLAMRQRPLWEGSNPKKFKTWEILGDDLIRFLEENNLQNIIGVGHSMGGIATVIAAAKRPELFSQVILIDPVLFLNNIYLLNKFTPIWLRKKIIPVAKIALKRKDSWPTKQMAFDSLRSKKIFELIPDKIFSEFIDGSIKENSGGTASLIYSKEWEAQVYCTPANAWPYLAKLNQPTLAIKASGSNLLDPPVWEKWQRVQPDARFDTVEKSSHLLPLERPEIIVDLVRSFLGKK
jgi:pimeloyl-ACP methyl ester carboxylesterase